MYALVNVNICSVFLKKKLQPTHAEIWKYRWITGDRVADIAPNMVKMVSKR
jgi:hypothetical protein